MKRIDRRPLIRDLLAATPKGIGVDDMAEQLRVHYKNLAKEVQLMRAAGEIVFVGVGSSYARWCLIENRAVAQADYEALSEESKRYAKMQSNLRQNERRKMLRTGMRTRDIDKVVRIVVDAKTAAPLRPAGPPSVWALGA